MPSHPYIATILSLAMLAGSQECRPSGDASEPVEAENAIALNDSAMVLFQKQSLAQDSSSHDDVIALLDGAIAVDSTYRPAYMNKASVLQNAGRYEEAIQVLERWLTSNPEDLMARTAMGMLLVLHEERKAADQQLSLALSGYDRKIRSHPDSLSLLLNRAFVKLLLGRRAESVTELDSLALVYPATEEVMMMRAIVADYDSTVDVRTFSGR